MPLHRPGSDLDQHRNPRDRKDPAPGGHRRLLPLLHVGLASARWLLSKPRKLEATKRHSVGHPELRPPWPTYFVTHPGSLSCDSPPALLDKLVPRRSSSTPFLARCQVGGGGVSRRPRKPEALRGTAPRARAPTRGARAPGPKTGRARCTCTALTPYAGGRGPRAERGGGVRSGSGSGSEHWGPSSSSSALPLSHRHRHRHRGARRRRAGRGGALH